MLLGVTLAATIIMIFARLDVIYWRGVINLKSGVVEIERDDGHRER